MQAVAALLRALSAEPLFETPLPALALALRVPRWASCAVHLRLILRQIIGNFRPLCGLLLLAVMGPQLRGGRFEKPSTHGSAGGNWLQIESIECQAVRSAGSNAKTL
jgi:hypothetical protein